MMVSPKLARPISIDGVPLFPAELVKFNKLAVDLGNEVIRRVGRDRTRFPLDKFAEIRH
jgi:hypothetical protein